MSFSESELSRSLVGWRPEAVEATARVNPWSGAAFAGVIGADRPAPVLGEPLPPLWHWFAFLEQHRQSELGPDGHPRAGHFLPPIPDRQRMFAGGRFQQRATIPIGADVTCRTAVAGVDVKSGLSGELAFVTTRSDFAISGAVVASEEQDIVYRSGRSSGPRPSAAPQAADPAAWHLDLAIDPVVLFRFSALTFNAHRIHYDQPYATLEEGYPDLVVHGPLLALLALELPRVHAPQSVVSRFEYRLLQPAFAPAYMEARGTPAGDDVVLEVGVPGLSPSLRATATLV